ncbi:alpha/beta fold hydrolase [Calothrix sp. PCC 7507]|uniref:alpha/beta fold hydrolase n=1 Tax=Calothrix sp. PCC 7507 TaxID=99598 RepID=UPI00029EC417|nr:alpha/beta hydrolase [Calothrix sp. PCC 7507]AFY32756.1 Soluble epoxide hydrolase [Calothrix sp. PCC 7507]
MTPTTEFEHQNFQDAIARHRLQVNGIRLHFATSGVGDPVVLLHGWPQTWYAWRKVIPLLARHYTVIAPDLRGFGDSSKPVTGYDKKTVAQDIHALVHELGYENIFLVGHDLGGQVAYAYAAQYPLEVRRFVFMESNLPGFGLERSMDVANGGSWHFGFNMAGDISEALVQGRESLFIKYFFRRETVGTIDPRAINDNDIDEYTYSLKQPGALRGMFAHYRALFQDAADNKEFGKSLLPMPVLAVAGDQGYHQNTRKAMEAVAKDVRSVIIQNSGHYVPEEQPKLLVHHLLAFFQE